MNMERKDNPPKEQSHETRVGASPTPTSYEGSREDRETKPSYSRNIPLRVPWLENTAPWMSSLRRSRAFKLGLIILLIVGIYIIIMVTDTSDSNSTSQSSDMNMVMPTKTAVSYPTGTPAISPTLPGEVPTYTVEDVQHYIDTHTLPAGLTFSGKRPIIAKIEFIAAHQVPVLVQRKPVRPDTTLVCYVELNGMFVQTTPTTRRNSTAIEVFDAKTGNMLLWGV